MLVGRAAWAIVSLAAILNAGCLDCGWSATAAWTESGLREALPDVGRYGSFYVEERGDGSAWVSNVRSGSRYVSSFTVSKNDSVLYNVGGPDPLSPAETWAWINLTWTDLGLPPPLNVSAAPAWEKIRCDSSSG